MAATITPGYAWSSTGQVTNTNLALLVSNATISNIDATNMASGYGMVITSTTSPSNTASLWLNSSAGNTPYYYNGASWVTLASASSGITGQFKNLKIVYATAATVTITADELLLNDTSSPQINYKLVSVNKTPNIAGSAGVNALDTGSELSSQWYYIWVVTKADGTQGACYSLSTSLTTVLSNLTGSGSTGYVAGALVGVVRNDGSSNFIAFKQYGKKYMYKAVQSMATGAVGNGSWTSIDTTAYVPASVSLVGQGIFGGAGAYYVSITNDGTIGTGRGSLTYNTYGNGGFFHWQFDIVTANTLYWQSEGGGTVYATGFDLTVI